MRRINVMAGAAVLALVSASAWATSCDEVKSEIDAKLQAKGVKSYTLEVVAADAVKDRKVVGSCEAGTKKIVYSRDSAMAKSDSAAPTT